MPSSSHSNYEQRHPRNYVYIWQHIFLCGGNAVDEVYNQAADFATGDHSMHPTGIKFPIMGQDSLKKKKPSSHKIHGYYCSHDKEGCLTLRKK